MHNWAVDDKAARTKWATIRADDKAPLNHAQVLELIDHAAAIALVDSLLGPYYNRGCHRKS